MNPEFRECVLSKFYDISHEVSALDRDNIALPVGLCDFDANLLHKDLIAEESMRMAKTVGVKWFVVPGSSLTDSLAALNLSQSNSDVIAATAGIHPFNTSTVPHNNSTIEELENLVQHPFCRSVV
jgi:Tat protein secretion system quality control protein TatD with DNase activity